MAQGILAFHYESASTKSGLTGRAGLPLYLELASVAGLDRSIERHVGVAGKQGWTDEQLVQALTLLNLAGGDCMDDLDILEADEGLGRLVRAAEDHGRSRSERRRLRQRWREERKRALPSPSVVGRWLEGFHDAEEEARRQPGKAFIPATTEGLLGLSRVNGDLLAFAGRHLRQKTATLDADATLVGTAKDEALFCYKGYKAYQPLNVWWAEPGLMVHSEFRDGNVPAGFQKVRVVKEALDYLPAEVKKVYLRTDTAGYQEDLLKFCAKGESERFGVIEFAISADVTSAFKKAVAEVGADAWQPVPGTKDHEWAEVCYVPDWAGRSRKGPEYRFLAIREPLQQPSLPGVEIPKELPFQTLDFGHKGPCKLFGVVTNRTLPGGELIRWHRERCGKSEEAHSVMKGDLAGGRMPCKWFGANAAWWAVMILAHNLNALMKSLVLKGAWVVKRLKALRFALIDLPGVVVTHARRLIVRLSAAHPALGLILAARRQIAALAQGPAG